MLTANFDPRALVSASAAVDAPRNRYAPIIEQAIANGVESRSLIYLTDRREDSVDAAALPLKASDGKTCWRCWWWRTPAKVWSNCNNISARLDMAWPGIGILLAIVASLWITSRISRPIERLARCSVRCRGRQLGHARRDFHSHDEVGELARSFNHMTQQLSEQRERLVQSERVAAWRELARRLAHELKNPLFPLQLTVENLTQARSCPAPSSTRSSARALRRLPSRSPI